jgi:hypothetical protein
MKWGPACRNYTNHLDVGDWNWSQRRNLRNGTRRCHLLRNACCSRPSHAHRYVLVACASARVLSGYSGPGLSWPLFAVSGSRWCGHCKGTPSPGGLGLSRMLLNDPSLACVFLDVPAWARAVGVSELSERGWSVSSSSCLLSGNGASHSRGSRLLR